MKCECKECNGSGEIECPDCNGTGEDDREISDIVFDKEHPYFEELTALQGDAKRVSAQFRELARRNPARLESYDGQLRATLNKIERQAEEVFNPV